METCYAIEKLVSYAVREKLIEETDRAWAINQLLFVLRMDEFTAPEEDGAEPPLDEILEALCKDAYAKGIITKEQYKEIKAGNDLRMPSGFPARLKKALELGLITREELETSGKRILALILKFE